MFQADLKQYLLDNLIKKKPASNNRQIVTRCPFCGDSSDPNSMHLYIGPFDGDESHPIWYNCRRCYVKGIFNSNLLRKLDVYSTDIGILVSKYNKGKNNYTDKSNSFKVKNPLINNTEKLNYLNQRLGVNFSIKDFVLLKVVFGLYSLLDASNINYYTDDIMDSLDDHYIGFLSNDNIMITFRNIKEDNQYRYVDYKLSEDKSNRIYTIPTQINLYSKEPIRIYITEGPFDILGLYLNTNNPKTNALYCAALGKGDFINVIKFIICKLGIINAEYHLCLDNDMKGWELPYIVDTLNKFNVDIYTHNNIYPNEKDFGVPKERIKESIKQISKRKNW